MNLRTKPIRWRIALMLALLSAGPARAEWYELGRTDDFRIYVDNGSIRRNGAIVGISQLIDFVSAQWVDTHTVISSVKSAIEFDCDTRRMKTFSVEAFSEQMAGGRSISNEVFDKPEWQAVKPDSSAAGVWKFVCMK